MARFQHSHELSDITQAISAYQQAVQIPLENVKRLWEEYQEFENKLDKITVCGPLHHAALYVIAPCH